MSFGLQTAIDVHSGNYVYYRRLAKSRNPEYRDLYASAMSAVVQNINKGSNTGDIASYFFSLRDSEYNKEVRLLSDKFGAKITNTYDKSNQATGEELIKAFNKMFNFKDVFIRNLKIIQEDASVKQLVTYFPTYFQQAWVAAKDSMATEIEKNIKQNMVIEDAVQILINKWLPEIVRDAIKRMFSVEEDTGVKGTKKTKQAYKQLLEPIEDLNNEMGNRFIESFIQSYNLRNIANILIENITLESDVTKKIENFSIDKHISFHSMGGLAAENLVAYLGDMVASVLDENFTASRSGDTGQKSDVIFTFGIPTNVVEDWLENTAFGNRKKNIEAVQKLEKELAEFENGFIVYTNVKNYSVFSDSFKGFPAGNPMTLNAWEGMMQAMGIKSDNLIFTVLQLIPGAIADNQKENVSTMFARGIAASLFDDFDVSDYTPNSSSMSIHLLNLNGIYTPLSFYFDLLGRAFQQYDKTNVNNLIKVQLSLPDSILFPTQVEENRWRKNNPNASPWQEQQQDAMAKSRISYYFLQGYTDLIKSLSFK